MRGKKKISLLFICAFVILLSACSYKEFEDSLKGKVNNEEEEQDINPSRIPDSSPESGGESLFTIGDTITYENLDNQSVQYTLNQVHILDNINDLELNVDDFGDKRLLSDDGTIDGTNQLVVIDVTVKNINLERDNLEEGNPILYIEPAVGFKEGIEDPNGPFFVEAEYFSNHPPLDQNGGQDYWQFPLAIGDEIEVKVGWFLPADRLEKESLYYIIGSETSPEYHQYFELHVD